MAFSSSPLPILLAITIFLALQITQTAQAFGSETRLHFYYRERTLPPNATAIKVVSSPLNQTDPTYTFGNIFVFDDPITPDLNTTSRILGRVQGTLVIASLDGFDGLYTFNVVFTNFDPWTGSYLTVVGRNPTQKAVKELPVFGGTGLFSNAHGTAVVTRLNTTDPSSGIIIFEVDVIISNK
ncbi:dirigent protein 21-like [Phalaenopsis equestris]|uniref:dirigent protein 21-like n=1 Tax=Phalaenopsis equestris TaxID=78828 RepID=UPI0009E251DC|nr:dirigent protein 21-like [Phalaenopsis equestris]